MREPKYLKLARSHIGLKELTGHNDHPLILNWWVKLNAKWLYKQAWCGLFLGHCFSEFGYSIPKAFYRAKAWLDWGVKADRPCVGCVVIFDRKGGGHVGYILGKDNIGRLLVLGGNQSNQISIAPFDRSRVLGYRVPVGFVGDLNYLPVMTSQGVSSENEA